MIPDYWQDALTQLTHTDEIIARLIVSYPNEILKNQGNPFSTLIRAVVGQQISVKAADAVWQRLEETIKIISPSNLLKIEAAQLRECGLSRQKISYISAIANAFESETLTASKWQIMSDKEVINQLIKIKGIGQWTADMFLIFHLNRPDILPLADIGLLNAIKLHYCNLTKSEILTLSQKWQPYRTVATWYLWLSLDPVTVQY